MLSHACDHQRQEHVCPNIPWSYITPKVEKFFFCSDDIEHCVKGSCHKWVNKFFADQEKPPILLVWFVKFGTNLNHIEILKLENVCYQLPQNTASFQLIFSTPLPPPP